MPLEQIDLRSRDALGPHAEELLLVEHLTLKVDTGKRNFAFIKRKRICFQVMDYIALSPRKKKP